MREKTEQTIQEKEEELTVGSCFVFFIYFFNVAIIFFDFTAFSFTADACDYSNSTQSKQWRIELLHRYKRAKNSRIIMSNIRKLYLYLFLLYCMFTLSG